MTKRSKDVDWLLVGVVSFFIILIIVVVLHFNIFPGIECQEAGGAWVQNAWGWYSCVQGVK